MASVYPPLAVMGALLCCLHGAHASTSHDPLLLTPIADTDPALARLLSHVAAPSIYNGSSYAGFFTVDVALGNHLFFWYFPSMTSQDAPLLVWLNGGAGISSLQGLFMENGPVEIDQHLYVSTGNVRLIPRNSSWVGPFSMLYIDNPVGVGFSFSDSGKAGRRTTSEEYGADLYSALKQFYGVFDEQLDNDLYIGGQSYAGKYVTSFAHAVHRGNPTSEVRLPLRGIYLGGPLYYPEMQAYGFMKFVNQLGVVDDIYLETQKKYIEETFRMYKKNPFLVDVNRMVSAVLSGFDHKVFNFFGDLNCDYDNYVSCVGLNRSFSENKHFLEDLKQAVHAGQNNFKMDDSTIREQLAESGDFLRSNEPWMGELMDSYKVLVFNGADDLITNSWSVDAAVNATRWAGHKDYLATPRSPWQHGTFSYVRSLCRVVVRGAGHQVPTDQPVATLRMMTEFVNNGCVAALREV